MTSTIYLSDRGQDASWQSEYDSIEDAANRLIQLGICPAGQAGVVACRALQQLKAKYPGAPALKLSSIWTAFLTFARQEMQVLQKQMDQNFGLTEEEFNKMLAALFTGDKSMFELVFLSHFAACRNYLVKACNAPAEDAYDATMDTLLEFHRRLLAGKIQYGNLRYLFTKMSTQVYQKGRRKTSIFEGWQADVVATVAAEEDSDREAALLLDKAWNKLGEGCQHILKAFYYEDKNLNTLAMEMGKDHAAMRKQKQRCVDSLRAYFIRFS